MKSHFICAVLLIIGMGAAGCGAFPEQPVACTEDPIQLGEQGEFSFQTCPALGMECNQAATLADVCPAFMAELEAYIRDVFVPMIGDDFLPPFIDAEEFVAMLFEEHIGICGEVDLLGDVGTCQPLGSEGAVCAEDDDCLGDLACVAGLCAAPVPECEQDTDCLGELVCVEGACVEPVPECVEDLDCEEGLVCVEGACVEPVPECVEDLDCEEGLVCVEELCVVPAPAD